MSLIYKSLQRVQNENDVPSVVVSRRQRKRDFSTGISKRLLGFLAVFVALSLAGFFFFTWMQQEVARLSPQIHSNTTAIKKALDEKKEEPVNATASNGTAQKVTQMLDLAKKKVEKTLPALSKPTKVQFAAKKKLGMEDLVKPTMDLERHFATLARKNQSILELEKKLVQHWKRGRVDEAAEILKELEQAAGKKSVLVRKWQGLIVLQKGEYAVAEDTFRSLLDDAAEDLTVRLNLVQALLAQGKTENARKEMGRVKKDFPGNSRVEALEARAF